MDIASSCKVLVVELQSYLELAFLSTPNQFWDSHRGVLNCCRKIILVLGLSDAGASSIALMPILCSIYHNVKEIGET
jgi:hypothetical protein